MHLFMDFDPIFQSTLRKVIFSFMITIFIIRKEQKSLEYNNLLMSPIAQALE